ncbi:MAG TPA: hypothetical protein VFH48_27065 [Chloroflexota bacterium]|nr:hypothetical protein [Chloroflexota bacterium]
MAPGVALASCKLVLAMMRGFTDGSYPALSEQDAPTTGRSDLTLVASQPS